MFIFLVLYLHGGWDACAMDWNGMSDGMSDVLLNGWYERERFCIP